ncbi:MAG: hypothetical protein LKE85_13305 [Lachnospiraceae bacterium]|jgi:hypothetical protein|nr:hypothetical protein [Lachnospiraceae bacterium]
MKKQKNRSKTVRRGSLCGLFPYLALITGTGAELVRDLAGSCRISAQSVPQVTVWHNPNGENTEIKLPFAPLATCRMTVIADKHPAVIEDVACPFLLKK